MIVENVSENKNWVQKSDYKKVRDITVIIKETGIPIGNIQIVNRILAATKEIFYIYDDSDKKCNVFFQWKVTFKFKVR